MVFNRQILITCHSQESNQTCDTSNLKGKQNCTSIIIHITLTFLKNNYIFFLYFISNWI